VEIRNEFKLRATQPALSGTDEQIMIYLNNGAICGR